MELIPPIETIAANNVGIHDPKNVIAEYTRIGKHIFKRLEQSAGLRADSDVLDVGCGTGRVALPMTEFLTSGTYTGIDVVKSSIDWCQQAYRTFDRFKFIHADVHSVFYNPTGQFRSENYSFPFPDNSFDVVWSSSLFTHMLLPGVDNYLKEMARVIRPGKYIWNSYLLLDQITEPSVLVPRNDGRRMPHPVPGGRIAYKDKPEHVVGLYVDGIKELHHKHGLTIAQVRYTNWSGARKLVSLKGQDVIIAVKKAS
jgi:SAM-dependent methyltransferase